VKLSAVHKNQGGLLQTVGRSMRTDEQQCLSTKALFGCQPSPTPHRTFNGQCRKCVFVLLCNGPLLREFVYCTVARLLFVGERVCDVAFWKEELLAEIQRMESECDNMTVL